MPESLGMGFFDRLRFSWGKNTVRILLDLDGAVAAEGLLRDGGYRSFSGSGYATWRVRNEVLDWIAQKSSDERVELVWSTTWQQYANTILEEMGIEPIEWISFDETYQRPEDWYKRDGLKLFLEDHKDPIVIVDDELPPAFLKVNNPRLLCIKTNPLIGLTDEDLERIDRLVEDYRSGRLGSE